LSLLVTLAPLVGVNAQQETLPPVAQRGLPNEGHRALQPLIGRWRVTKTSSFPAISSNGPVSSADLTATREWLADGRFIRETVTGTMAGQPYFRTGLLGYSTMDRRYEWVTVDALNANMMIYQGRPGSGAALPTDVAGAFTDQGLMGESTVGRVVRQRTRITIDGPDRNVLQLFVTPPGGRERLVDEMLYVRMQ
jgi:hypothetical protein